MDGKEQLVGGDGFDFLQGGNGADTVFGGAGIDLLEGRRGGEDGGSGADGFVLLASPVGSPTLIVVHDFEADTGGIRTSSGAPAPTQTVVTSSPLGDGLLIQADNGNRAMFLIGVQTELPELSAVERGVEIVEIF